MLSLVCFAFAPPSPLPRSCAFTVPSCLRTETTMAFLRLGWLTVFPALVSTEITEARLSSADNESFEDCKSNYSLWRMNPPGDGKKDRKHERSWGCPNWFSSVAVGREPHSSRFSVILIVVQKYQPPPSPPFCPHRRWRPLPSILTDATDPILLENLFSGRGEFVRTQS